MPSLLDRALARIALLHAGGVYARFLRTLGDVDGVQQRVLRDVLGGLRGSSFSRAFGLDRVTTGQELRRAIPLQTYEDMRPFIDRVRDGDVTALFAAGRRIHMFATSSGTTAQPKYVPVTSEFVREYRRGWNTFGLKMLSDHPRAILRAILQSSGRFDESFSRSGVPCGAITGLLARTQKGIVRRYYVGVPDIAYIDEPRGRYYALARFGIVRDVAFAVTANPATLIRIAQTADEESERLIRDVRDGGIDGSMVGDSALAKRLSAPLKPDVKRARELDALRRRDGALRPREFWKIEFLACWTGGSMGHYLARVADWFGPVPVRDVGLLASEGRVSLPLEDGNPSGVLDVLGSYFEFIPAEQLEVATPEILETRQLEVGREYGVVLTNFSGLTRYRLDDVVRVRGWLGQAPLVEFLYRAGRVSSVAGEKVTENQVVAAAREFCKHMGLLDFDFVVAPVWGEPPHYRVSSPAELDAAALERLDILISSQNDEYRSRRKSGRIGSLQFRRLGADAIRAMDRRLTASRKSASEQYKRPCLFSTVGGDDAALGLTEI